MVKSLVIAVLVAGGVVVPVAAAQAHPGAEAGQPEAPAGMARVHELMEQGNLGMARMHELMEQGNPGMAQMCEQMQAGGSHHS